MESYIDYFSLPWVVEILIPQFFKLTFLIFLFFYWIPSKVFPQVGIRDTYDKVMFNILYMVLFIEIIIPLMLLFRVFSYLLFLSLIVVTKLLVMKYYEKIHLRLYFVDLQNKIMVFILNSLDDLPGFLGALRMGIYSKMESMWQSFSIISFFQASVIALIFLYPAALMSIRGFLTFSYGASDTAQFYEWVSYLYRGELFYFGKTAGADFYGTTVFAFFLSFIANLGPQIIFSLYPFFTILFLLFGLFYVLKKMTGSTATGVFAVFIFGVILISPLIDLFGVSTYITTHPPITYFLGMEFYLPWPLESLGVATGGVGMIPSIRNSTGLPYELSYMFYLLNLYFLIKSFSSDDRKYIWWYGVTLLLVFTFHGGIAIYLMVVSLLITFWAIINGKLTIAKLKIGLLAVFLGAIIGNAWLLSILKYGGLQHIGAAAPIIDVILNKLGVISKESQVVSISEADFGFEELFLVLPSYPLLGLIVAALFLLIIVQFSRHRFEWSTFSLIAIGVIFIDLSTVLGLPKFVDPTRAAEALLLSWAMILALYFYLLIVVPLSKFAQGRWARLFLSAFSLIVAANVAWLSPKWVERQEFWEALNSIEYSDFSYLAYKIKKDFQPFTWTIISYVPEYAEILTKGYHYNTQDFIQEYDPKEDYLRIPTPLVFLFVELKPHPYAGMGEWYYRWRSEVEGQFNEWVAIFSLNHPGKVEIYYHSPHVIVYKIENKEYMDYLFKEEQRKSGHYSTKEVYTRPNNFADESNKTNEE